MYHMVIGVVFIVYVIKCTADFMFVSFWITWTSVNTDVVGRSPKSVLTKLSTYMIVMTEE